MEAIGRGKGAKADGAVAIWFGSLDAAESTADVVVLLVPRRARLACNR